jgi:transposase
MQAYKKQAEDVSEKWCWQAYDIHVHRLVKMENTLFAHRTGILTWYDCHISTIKMEGINNNIKPLFDKKGSSIDYCA